jgi:hypothetical protein
MTARVSFSEILDLRTYLSSSGAVCRREYYCKNAISDQCFRFGKSTPASHSILLAQYTGQKLYSAQSKPACVLMVDENSASVAGMSFPFMVTSWVCSVVMMVKSSLSV